MVVVEYHGGYTLYPKGHPQPDCQNVLYDEYVRYLKEPEVALARRNPSYLNDLLGWCLTEHNRKEFNGKKEEYRRLLVEHENREIITKMLAREQRVILERQMTPVTFGWAKAASWLPILR